MKVTVDIEDQSFDIEIYKNKDQVHVTRDGKTQTYNVQKTSSGYILEHLGHIFHTNLQQCQDQQVCINVENQTIDLTWKDPYALYANEKSASNQGEIQSVMPGRVVKIHVKEGDTVTQGDPILVLEAMKMENEIKASKDGVVSAISVTEGQSVDSGTLLITIE